jgi:SAM-dependent methyltransferase
MPASPPPYLRSAPGYDGLYARRKDYRGEVSGLLRLLRDRGGPTRGDWLEVACGSGLHVRHLPKRFRVEGVDVSPPMLALARKRVPGVRFHLGDMRTFDLGRRFDVVSCLFSSIGYMTTTTDLRRAIATFARHVRPGGVVVVEPWYTPSAYRPGTVYLDAISGRSRTSTHQVRMIVAKRRGRVSVMDAHHLVGTPEGVEHFVERHEMGLFSAAEVAAAFRAAGLVPRFDREGVTDRGLWFGHAAPADGAGHRPRPHGSPS